jgi:hypothetical protein
MARSLIEKRGYVTDYQLAVTVNMLRHSIAIVDRSGNNHLALVLREALGYYEKLKTMPRGPYEEKDHVSQG